MKTSALWTQYQGYTRDLTEHARKLGFAGVAICWIFRTTQFTFPPLIYWAIGAFVAYFICDILHSLFGALLTKWYVEREEFKLIQKSKPIDSDVPKPRWLDWPAFTLFLMKSMLVILGFVLIGFELCGRLADLRAATATMQPSP
ncbi:hypothetical protein HZ994_09255 [Akkermansiaceae bacterium]|nr:hypothetical protein HZ994_09255 [Akkermansiaceae bacterium]